MNGGINKSKTGAILIFKERKGLEKPIFVVASLVLAMMFIAVYFTAASGWIDTILEDFLSSVGEQGVEEE